MDLGAVKYASRWSRSGHFRVLLRSRSGNFRVLPQPEALCFGAFWCLGRARAKGKGRLKGLNPDGIGDRWGIRPTPRGQGLFLRQRSTWVQLTRMLPPSERRPADIAATTGFDLNELSLAARCRGAR